SHVTSAPSPPRSYVSAPVSIASDSTAARAGCVARADWNGTRSRTSTSGTPGLRTTTTRSPVLVTRSATVGVFALRGKVSAGTAVITELPARHLVGPRLGPTANVDGCRARSLGACRDQLDDGSSIRAQCCRS